MHVNGSAGECQALRRAARSPSMPHARTTITTATMKPSWGVLFSILYCTASAAYEPSVSPETARLIIAQRLGLARFHSIEHADTPTIQHINKYGGMQPRLFGGDVEQGTRAHLLMWIDGVEEKEATGTSLHAHRHSPKLTDAQSSPKTTRNAGKPSQCRIPLNHPTTTAW
jgi:hypothetical protein